MITKNINRPSRKIPDNYIPFPLKDQFKIGIYTDIYSGKKFTENFISKIVSNKNYVPSTDVELVVSSIDSDVIDSTINKFEAYLNSKISEKQYNVFSTKFFKEDDYEDNYRDNYVQEEIKQEVKEVVKPREVIIDESNKENINKLKSVKYNKSKRIYEVVMYENVGEFDKDSEWNKPRISRNNVIKSS